MRPAATFSIFLQADTAKPPDVRRSVFLRPVKNKLPYGAAFRNTARRIEKFSSSFPTRRLTFWYLEVYISRKKIILKGTFNVDWGIVTNRLQVEMI